jgi:hypothetical protein
MRFLRFDRPGITGLMPCLPDFRNELLAALPISTCGSPRNSKGRLWSASYFENQEVAALAEAIRARFLSIVPGRRRPQRYDQPSRLLEAGIGSLMFMPLRNCLERVGQTALMSSAKLSCASS